MPGSCERVRVFIGSEPKTEIARRVLECSIMRRTEMRVDFTPMIGPGWEYPTSGIKQGTGFSLRRWMIPAYCNFQGRAIYLDADQLCLGDIHDLWTKPEQHPHPQGVVWCTYQPDKFSKAPWPQTSVMVINCELARGEWGFDLGRVLDHLRRTPAGYADFMHASWLTRPPVRIGDEWNALNTFTQGVTRLIHYTKEPEQPWYRPDHPLARHWQLELVAAINMEMVSVEMMRGAMAKWGRPEDWRTSNGLHPDYARFIPKPRSPRAAGRKSTPAHYHKKRRKESA